MYTILHTSSSSVLMYRQGLLVTVREARMFCHIGLLRITTEISSYMMPHSCGKLYHWLSEHECGTCMMVLRHISAALCEVFSVRSIIPEEESLRGLYVLLTTIESSGSLSVETLNSSCIRTSCLQFTIALWMDACQTIRNYTAIYERMRLTMICVEACTESNGDHLEHFLQMYSFSYSSQNNCFSTYVDMEILSSVGMCNSWWMFSDILQLYPLY
jgi:hypothetical protein